MSRRAIVCITFGFTAGVLVRSFADWGAALPLFFAALAAAILSQSFLVSSSDPAVSGRSLAAALFFLLAAAGVIRFELKDQSEFAAAALAAAPAGGQAAPVFLTGVIMTEPDRRDGQVQLLFQPDNWPVKIILLAPPYPEFAYGDRLRVTGRLTKIRDFTGDRDQLVPYAGYRSVSETYFQMFEPKIDLLARDQGNPIKSVLFRFKSVLLGRLARAVPEPEASLLTGLTLGARQSLGAEWTERLRRAGLLHIVVLSGYNLSVVAAALFAGLGFLSRRKRIIAAAAAIALFTVMVGAGPATVRAAVMALIALLAQFTGRRYEASRALGLAGLVMVVGNPKVLVFDPGFQLSFLATAGLIWLAPKIAARLHFIKWLAARELVAVTTAAQLAVLPWFVLKSAAVPLFALPANLLVLPLVPAAMLFGFLTMLIPFSLLAAPAWFLAAYILGVARLAALLF